jgi:putative exosortase-associated protein (TIGR04073 family)
MNRKTLCLVCGLTVALALPARAGTDDPPQGHHALRKLGRGFANVLFGIVEVPNQITKVTAEQGGGAGTTYGVGKGLGRWLWREVVGVYEVVTFPIPLPKGYRPIMQPEFPGEDYEP